MLSSKSALSKLPARPLAVRQAVDQRRGEAWLEFAYPPSSLFAGTCDRSSRGHAVAPQGHIVSAEAWPDIRVGETPTSRKVPWRDWSRPFLGADLPQTHCRAQRKSRLAAGQREAAPKAALTERARQYH